MSEPIEVRVDVLIDGTKARSRTRATTVGPYVLVLDTVLPDRGIELHSLYTGHAGVRTLASHLMLARSLADTLAVEHEHDSIPVIHARRRCLYDHLQRLQDLLGESGASVHIPVDDAALETMED